MDVATWVHSLRGKEVIIELIAKRAKESHMVKGIFVSKVSDILLNDYTLIDGFGKTMEKGKRIMIRSHCWRTMAMKGGD